LATHADSHLRKKPIQARSRRTVEAILEATDRVLRRDGYEATSTNRIAQVAGYSVGSLYQYFADKESVVRTLIDEVVTREDEVVARRLADLSHAPLEESMSGTLEFLLQARWMQSHVYRVFAFESPGLFGVPALTRIQELQTACPGALQQLAARHWDELRKDDVAATLWVLAAASNAVTLQLAATPIADVTVANLLEAVADAWVLAARGPAPEHPAADALAASWLASDGASPMAGFSVRLADARGYLLRTSRALDPGRMAPVVFALAALPEVRRVSAELRPGVSDEALDRELQLFAAALLRAGERHE
jgi:AcrR family transcriptional regulator